MGKTPKLKSAKPTGDDAAYSAAKLEEEESRNDLETALNNGITLADSDEPTEYTMPCGYKDKDGVLHTTYTIREMTGRDEEAIDKPDMQQNPSKAINEILSRVVQSIGSIRRIDCKPDEWKNIIKSLYTGDQDTILMQIRKQSIGSEITAKHRCPNCKQKLTTIMDIDELETIPFKGETKAHFELPRGYKDKSGNVHREGTIRLATGLDREILTPAARKSLSRGNTLLLTRLCSFDDGLKVDDDVTANLVVRDREYLTEIMNDMAFGYNMQVDITCDQCGEEFTASLSAVNFT